MIKEAICEGSDVEEALLNAKRELGVTDTDDYDFEVVQREEKKKFGLFGGRPAKVRIFMRVDDPVEPEKPAETVKSVETVKAQEAVKEDKPSKPAVVELSEPVIEKAESFLRNVLDKMQLSDIAIEKTVEGNSMTFDLSGEEEGFVIGRRGETLDALQYLTSLVANHKNEEGYIKVTVNVGNYRDKREKTLEILGRKLAFKAIKTGKKTSLEPMNPYERRIIHTAVQKVNGAISWSEGENANRHVVIGPDPKSRNNRKGGYNNRRGGRRPYNGGRGRSSSPAPVNPDRVPLNEGGETGLYGRIDK